MMPGLDGISTLRILKGDAETRLIPVVLMTALNAVEDRVRGIEAGADDFLSKPVDDRELLARIRTALEVKREMDRTVDELRSTSAHLERYGRQERDVAVLALDLRPRDADLPDERRRSLFAATERPRRNGSERSERCRAKATTACWSRSSTDPDLRTRSIAAVEAALAILEEGEPTERPTWS